MIHEGFIGDRESDGWVEWTTSDSAWSYNASIACGNFLIVLGHGTDWGAPSDEHGCAMIVDLAGAEEDDSLGEVSFSWCMAGVLRAAEAIAATLAHPAPSNVVDAARELWFAMIQEGAADA